MSDARRALGPEYDPSVIKEQDQMGVIENERFYSDPPPDSTLSKPPVPPALPPIPTAHVLAEQAREERHYAEIRRLEHVNAMMKSFTAKTAPAIPTDRRPSTVNDL